MRSSQALPRLLTLCSVLLLSSCGFHNGQTICDGLDLATDSMGRVYAWNQKSLTILSSRLQKLRVKRPDVPDSSITQSFAVTARGTIAFVDFPPPELVAHNAIWIYASHNSIQYVERQEDCVSQARCASPGYRIPRLPNYVLGGDPTVLAASDGESIVMLTHDNSAWDLTLASNGHLLSQRRLLVRVPVGFVRSFASTEREGVFLAFPLPADERPQSVLSIVSVEYSTGARRLIGKGQPVQPSGDSPYEGIALSRNGDIVLSASKEGQGYVEIFDKNATPNAAPMRSVAISNSRGRDVGGIAVGASGLIYTETSDSFPVSDWDKAFGEIIAIDPHLNYSAVAKIDLPLNCHTFGAL